MHVPGYEVHEVIGRRGTGVVHRARRLADDRAVAIQVDDRPVVDRERFAEDTRAARALSAHPFVVAVLDAGVLADARPYVVMEPGTDSLDSPLPPDEVAELGQRIADVLVAAHDLGLAHGGIEASELLVRPDGVVGLAGFGLASVRAAATPAGDVRALTATLSTLLGDTPVSAEFLAILRRGYPDAAALRADLSQLTVAAAPRRPSTAQAPPATADDDEPGRGTWSPGEPSAPEPAPPTPVSRAVVSRAMVVVFVLVVVVAVVVLGWVLLAG
ncbi:protein kinase family protein [Actinophytocola sediminis]